MTVESSVLKWGSQRWVEERELAVTQEKPGRVDEGCAPGYLSGFIPHFSGSGSTPPYVLSPQG